MKLSLTYYGADNQTVVVFEAELPPESADFCCCPDDPAQARDWLIHQLYESGIYLCKGCGKLFTTDTLDLDTMLCGSCSPSEE